VPEWPAGEGALASVVWEQTDACLAVYREDPSRIEQDANNELRIAEGGYSRRQLFELLQNAVDAARTGGGRIEVLLSPDALYVANDGAPFTADGVRAIMSSDLSPKDDEQIGRFGIGFKSVLAVTSGPRIFSTTVALEFNGEWAAGTIEEAGFHAPRYPVMRLARTLNATVEAQRDPRLASLMEWACTVIALPLRARRDELARELRQFPPEFLLFSPHLTSARLADEPDPDSGSDPLVREIRRAEDGSGVTTIGEGGREQAWRVLTATYRPTPGERADAGRLASRESIDVGWAIPIPPKQGLGTFWAYFPTNAGTTLSGIINASWKLSDDRTNLLEGPFNEAILTSVLPSLLAQSLPMIHDVEDPGVFLDVLPARGREARNWADDVVNEPIFETLRNHPCLPDCRDVPRLPRDLRLFPDCLRVSWIEEWIEAATAPLSDWAHPAALATDVRRSKARRLVGPNPEGNPGVVEWLEALVGPGTTEASEQAVRLAARILGDLEQTGDSDAVREITDAVRSARILRLEDGSFVRPARGKVFVRASADDTGHGFVDENLAARPGVREALRTLGVVVLDRTGELRALLVNSARGQERWPQIWEAVRLLPQDVAHRIFVEELPAPLESVVKVRTAAGAWAAIGEVYLAGSVIPADGRRDRDLLVDPSFHGDDQDLLRELGAVSEPVWRSDPPREQWRDGYEQAMKRLFIEKATGSKPDEDKLRAAGRAPAWPLCALPQLSVEGRLEITRILLARGLPEHWTVCHSTNRGYGTLPVVPPEMWMVRKHGVLETSFGPLRPSRTLVPIEAVSADVLPIVELPPRIAAALRVRESVEELQQSDWQELKKIADTWLDDERRAEFYSWLPDRYRPETLVARVGPRREVIDLENVGVTADRAVYQSMLEAHVPALWVQSEDDVEERFVSIWGMPRGRDLLQEEVVAEPTGEPSFLVDEFPPLRLIVDIADHDILLQRCARLVRMNATPRGQVARPLPALRDGDRVLVTATEPADILRQVSEALNLQMARQDIARVLESMASSAADEHRRRIREAPDDDARLVEAVGVDALKRLVPRQALEALDQQGHEVDPRHVATLARAVHGIGLLKQLRSILEDRGLEPPRDWTGRRTTRRYVADLGFPIEWAGFPSTNPPALERVDGPVTLKPLHPYQLHVTAKLKRLLVGPGPDRGVVALPTGAGKTRVTVEALVDEVREGRLSEMVVWIAQSEELCEQAAETWTYVWRAVGPMDSLSIGRFWGSNEVSEAPASFQLVIATIDKLDSVRDRGTGDFDWLREPEVVVVDEAHGSITPSYTRVLEWLGRSSRSRDGRRPLVGLTATPFRGVSTEETERLINRYDRHRLDDGAFLSDDPYAELQAAGVLAKVRQHVLDGIDFAFEAGELEDIERMKRFPAAAGTRLGEDLERTLRIVDSIAGLPDDWTVLLFAPSVENARSIAALLMHRGITAVSVSADTEAAARRYYIEEFKTGRIRVLTNYSVLTQGFDAPAVRAVYVTRPTFSPNLYQQMIGRGLRGPLNGGSEEVLIVNVQDNLDKYGDLLAFRGFEQLWRR
jgi:superfamily II DNA or RNA helicase